MIAKLLANVLDIDVDDGNDIEEVDVKSDVIDEALDDPLKDRVYRLGEKGAPRCIGCKNLLYQYALYGNPVCSECIERPKFWLELFKRIAKREMEEGNTIGIITLASGAVIPVEWDDWQMDYGGKEIKLKVPRMGEIRINRKHIVWSLRPDELVATRLSLFGEDDD